MLLTTEPRQEKKCRHAATSSISAAVVRRRSKKCELLAIVHEGGWSSERTLGSIGHAACLFAGKRKRRNISLFSSWLVLSCSSPKSWFSACRNLTWIKKVLDNRSAFEYTDLVSL